MIASPETMTEIGNQYCNDLNSLKAGIEREGYVYSDYNVWLKDIFHDAKNELETTGDNDSDLRTSRDIKLENIGNNSFVISSYNCKMLLENNYIYDISNPDRSRVQVIDLQELKGDRYSKLYDSSGKFNIKEPNNYNYLIAVMKIMNLLNRLRNEKFSRNLVYSTKEGGIYAENFFNDTNILKQRTLKELSDDMGVDTYSLAGRICEYFNNKSKF